LQHNLYKNDSSGYRSTNLLPVNTYQPLFKEIQPVECVYEEIPCDIMGIFEAAEVLSIRQHVKWLPKRFSCPPCVEQESSFSVYAGLTRDAQAEFLRIDEVDYHIHDESFYFYKS